MKSKQQIIDLFLEKPVYLDMGAGKLAKRFKKTKQQIYECKQMARDVKSREFKRLFFDIETSPNIGLFWDAGYKKRIPYDNIIQERRVICLSYKWEGEDKVYNLRWDDNQCDAQMIREFAEVIRAASEVVGHNSERFDIPWLRGRALYHRIPFPTYIKSLDTLNKSRPQFRLNAYNLDYLAKFLKVGGKIEDGGWDNWVKITMNNDPEALKIMMDYCDNDVIILEDVFHAIENYIKLPTHKGATLTNSKASCPKCGSTNVEYIKPWVTSAGTVQRIMKCKECGVDYKISNKEWLHIMK